MGDFKSFVKGKEVLLASLVLMLLSMIVVPPSDEYADYIDVRTLVVLFCFMACVAGIRSTGVFEVLAHAMLEKTKGIRGICAVLVLLPTVLAMFITNDVALITFVPFAILVLDSIGRRDLMIPVLVLQTVGVNLGCMVLPFGSPHNIYIDSFYNPSFPDYMGVTLPIAIVGGIILALMVCCIKNDPVSSIPDKERSVDKRTLAIMAALFVVCVASVLRIIPYQAAFVATVVVMLLACPKALKKVDYGLILTFIFLFVFAGNMATIDVIKDAILDMLDWNTAVSTAAISQVISNVPATVMLSQFTTDWQGLLAGSNIGGFGTPIASMASVITLRLYSTEKDSRQGRYLAVFTGANVVMLVALLAFYTLAYRRGPRGYNRCFSGLYAFRYARTAWSSSESDHSGVHWVLLSSLYHSVHLSMYSVMSKRSLITMKAFSGPGTHWLGRS